MTTIAVVYPGDGSHPGTRSGVPHSIARGIAASGVGVRHVSASPGRGAERAVIGTLTVLHTPHALRTRSLRAGRTAAYNGPGMGRLQTWTAHRRVRREDGVDGVVQIGSSYTLPAGRPTVTHDDMTVVQAHRAGYPGVLALSPRSLAARIERQRLAFERADACCVVTRWAARSVIEDYGIAPEKVHVVGGGRNHEPRPVERSWDVPRFLFVGKEWQRKNGPAVLQAFAMLRREIPEATLDVAGRHPQLDAPGVTTHGWLDMGLPEDRRRLDALFERATCFVMPSVHEPSGIVFSEANAAGIPSIGSTAGGSGELIGDAGRVVDPDDVDALLDAMRELADPATARRLSERARARSGLFTWPAVGERVLRALDLPDTPTDSLAEFLA